MTATDTPAPGPAEAVTDADRNPFVRRVASYAERVLRPAALRTDREGVTPDRIDELRRLGLLNHLAPVEHGGRPGLDRAAERRLHEIVAGACLNTWLVWAQHAPVTAPHGPDGARGTAPGELGRRALRGEVLLGAAISDVRRFPDAYVAARRTGGGWTFSGVVSWVSGWGLNAALTVAAVEPDTETVVTALVAVGERTRATPLQLSVVPGSRTVRVRLDDVPVPADQVISTQSLDAWRAADLAVAGDARPHHFGVAHAVLDELAREAHPVAAEVAATWAPRVAQLRADAYGLADEAATAGGGRHRLAERLATKVASGEALATLTRALVVARSGHGIAGDDTAQLHARSALFLLVQGQSADVRRAQLAHLAR
jgi:alkylation response protein AidB-like acyl-CoA dehydrogenase